MNAAVAGYLISNVVFSGAVGLGGVGAAVSFYHSNDLFNGLDGTVRVALPQPTPIPTQAFQPVITVAEDPLDIIPEEGK